MYSPLIISGALAARLLFMTPLITRGYSATSTTNVQDGDTFLAIADSAGIPVESLEAANPGVAASDLYVGQAINIPTDNEPATAMPVSNPALEAATAAVPTTLVTSASPPASSNSLLSGSPSAAPSESVSVPSSAASSPATTQGSSTASPSATPDSSRVTSMDTASGSASAAHSTTASATSTSAPAVTSSSASATSSSAPAATSSSTPPPPPSTTAPPPPPPSAPPSTPTSSTPNSPPAPVSCAPSPTGKYSDANDVKDKADGFCKAKSSVLLTDVQTGTLVDGSDQKSNKDDGSSNNEKGYNMTVTALPDCNLPDANVLYPLPGATEFNCTKLLYSAWETCYSNDGMGGSVAAGCLVYTFHADP